MSRLEYGPSGSQKLSTFKEGQYVEVITSGRNAARKVQGVVTAVEQTKQPNNPRVILETDRRWGKVSFGGGSIAKEIPPLLPYKKLNDNNPFNSGNCEYGYK